MLVFLVVMLDNQKGNVYKIEFFEQLFSEFDLLFRFDLFAHSERDRDMSRLIFNARIELIVNLEFPFDLSLCAEASRQNFGLFGRFLVLAQNVGDRAR